MKQENKQELFEKIFKEHLKIETYSKSIDNLLGPRLRNKINYKPYYQRNDVWDDNKATYFIESILLLSIFRPDILLLGASLNQEVVSPPPPPCCIIKYE